MKHQELKEKLAQLVRRKKQSVQEALKEGDKKLLHIPFVSANIILNDRLRLMKWFCYLLVFLQIGTSFYHWKSNSTLKEELAKREMLLIPTLPDFMKVRVGSLPDEVVFSFAEYVARQLATFSHRSVERQYREIAEFMTPELKHRFLFQAEKNFQLYNDLRVDEIFEFDPVRKFDVKNDKHGAKYVAEVRGVTKKYVEGKLRETIPLEIFVLEIRPTSISAKKPWMLQVESFRRTTPEEEERRKQAESIEQQHKDDSK